MTRFTLTNCDVADIVTEMIRFLTHITLLHLLNCLIDTKETLFEVNYLKLMLFTALAIVIYHLFLKKIYDYKINKMKKICPSAAGIGKK